MSELSNFSSESCINRLGEIREDSQKISDLFYNGSSKIILTYKGKFVSKNTELQLFLLSEIIESPLLQEFKLSFNANKNTVLPQGTIYLGQIDSENFFVLPLDASFPINNDVELHDSRSLAFSSNAIILELIFYAQGLISWHFTHQFCAKCGNKTQISHSGHSRKCLSAPCRKQHFPRIEPAVIFSICRRASNTDSEDKILLARQSSWPDKRFSVIAGFAEHGENLENSVAREAYEEVGLRVNNIHYLGSQPWPFPASLMIGFSCETTDQEIRLIDNELECAKWFSAQEIKQQVKSGELLMPFSVSISWRILDHWYQQQTGLSIESIKKANE